jgi:uncharacterized protein with PIN domain
MTEQTLEAMFICDRMVGSLCRYLRLMGYDTLSANDLPPGNRKEDTYLLTIARKEHRFLLTRDAELARRDSTWALYLVQERCEDQIRQIASAGLIMPALRLSRCSLCNCLLERITLEKLPSICTHIPEFCPKTECIFWCPQCRKVYWEGSHTRNMQSRIDEMSKPELPANMDSG